tara:strand:+ start:320 stop:736 length:417 start_codon:yes stop_codon:yes gene_type:complete
MIITKMSDSKFLNISLWILQIVIGTSFLIIGITNIITSNEDLITMGFTYIAHVPALVPKIAGISEVLGGIGLILPSVTRIQPQLTVWAAIGLILVCILAIMIYLWLGEWSNIPSPVITVGMLAFIVWGRNYKLPIDSR